MPETMEYKPRKPAEQVVEQDDGPKPTYKSWKYVYHNSVVLLTARERNLAKVRASSNSYPRKKYRKMRVHFDAQMKKSNDFFKLEHEAAETARRLQMEIDGLMDLLLDNNEARQHPNERGCIDISHADPTNPPFPLLKSKYSELTEEEEEFDLDGPLKDSAKAEYIRMIKDLHAKEKAEDEKVLGLKRSLSDLMRTVPHAPFQVNSKPPSAFGIEGVNPSIAKDLEIAPGHPEPVAYLSADRLDDLLAQTDSALGLPPFPHFNYDTKYKPLAPPLTERELEFENPVSVYNWLRQNEPKIFLQDGEPASLIEKAATKPGALRGAGKRAVLPAPSKPDAFEIVEEDGLGYDTSIGVVPHAKGREGSAAKRKRNSTEEDTGYRPKGGSSRPAKRKRESKGGGRGKKALSEAIVNEDDDDNDMQMGEGDGYLKPEN